ncbi:substrate-binding domain-containing protein [Streptacidiphilus sp. NEAU-YB345]|uniref:Substrate-binding domain-containing protein n=1 Tax=Streptacidiphilus fuscans TaxID=2789292 RepID=A0A931BAX9_9ACTN|nr:substrate-binding domain-containing protein [Streptacidiphilus fuscans]
MSPAARTHPRLHRARSWASVALPARTTLVDLTGATSEARLGDTARLATRHTLTIPDRPDALLGLCLGSGAGTRRAAHELGRRVPDDLLIPQYIHEPIAPGDRPPPITATDMFPRLQAKAAVDMLLAFLDGEHLFPRHHPGRPTLPCQHPAHAPEESLTRAFLNPSTPLR